MSNITSLIEAGPDAFSNLFDVKITFPTGIITLNEAFQQSVSVRIKDFPFPTFDLEPYNVAYKAVTLKRFAPKINLTRKLSLNLRLDAKWDIYRAFRAWKSIYVNEKDSNIKFDKYISLPTNLTDFGTIEVISYKANDKMANIENPFSAIKRGPIWKFEQVACMNVKEPEFTRDTATPIVLSVDFMFGVYTPPNETPAQVPAGLEE